MQFTTQFVPPSPMRLPAASGEYALRNAETQVLTPPRECVITCAGGTIWVTMAGDSRDHFLRQGQSLVCAAHAKVVVQAWTYAAQFSVAR
jgi:Protein of unknown function (DUF2917)